MMIGDFHSRRDFISRYSKQFPHRNQGRAARFFHRFKHRFIENGLLEGGDILELGVGGFEHLSFVCNFRTYLGIDLEADSSNRYPLVPFGQVPKTPGVYFSIGDAEHLTYPENSFNRIIMTCVIIHLSDPMKVLIECKKLLKTSGRLDFYLPCTTNILYGLAQSILTLSLPKHERKLYRLANSIDHINNEKNILRISDHVFAGHHKIRFWPFGFLKSPRFNLFCVISFVKK